MDKHDRHIFICYSSQQHLFASKLTSALKQSGVSVWIDTLALRAGDSLRARIEAALANAAYVIVILSPESVSSKWVQDELSFALTRQRAEQTRLVIPLLYRDCEIPPFLQDRLHIDFRKPRRFAAAFATLLHALSDEAMAVPRTVASPPNVREDFVEKLEKVIDGKKDPWFRSFRDHPLTLMLRKSMEVESFAGALRDEVAAALALFSGTRQAGLFNACVALAGFTSEIKARNLIRADLLDFLLALAQHRGLDTSLRMVALNALIDRHDALRNRWQQLRLLPNIFPDHSLDPLADVLIASHMGGNAEDVLGDLWTRAPLSYRGAIGEYLLRSSTWRATPKLGAEVLEDSSRTALRRRFRKLRRPHAKSALRRTIRSKPSKGRRGGRGVRQG